jgi:hypothetical protein
LINCATNQGTMAANLQSNGNYSGKDLFNER